MPWGRVDDSFYDHRKVDALEERLPGMVALAAVGLHWKAISWCNRQLTDGHVQRGRVGKLGGTVKLAGELVRVGLWEHCSEHATCYLVHDFLEFNESREEVLAKRERMAEISRLGVQARKRHGNRGRRGTVTAAVTGAVTDTVTATPTAAASQAAQPPYPTRTRTSESQVPTAVPARDAGAPSSRAVRLTKAQVEAWQPFDHPNWSVFRTAWHERGFRDPPTEAQRTILWPIADARPLGIAGWVREARKGSRADQVVEHVIAKWRELEADVGAEEEAVEAERQQREPSPERAGSILRRLVTVPEDDASW